MYSPTFRQIFVMKKFLAAGFMLCREELFSFPFVNENDIMRTAKSGLPLTASDEGEKNMDRFSYCEGGLHLVFEISEEKQVRLLHFSALPLKEEDLPEEKKRSAYRLYELQVSGYPYEENHGLRHVFTLPGMNMRYVGHKTVEDAQGRRLEIDTHDEESGLSVRTCFAFYPNLPVARCWNVITNDGTEAQGIEHLSSFTLSGIGKEGLQPIGKKMRLYIPHSGWQSESQWESDTLEHLGFSSMSCGEDSAKRIHFTNVGTWSCCEYVPMAFLEDTEKGTALFWQIETPGGWHWEISDCDGRAYLNISGPNELEHHWWKQIQPGESFTTIPVCVGSVIGNHQSAARALTGYRRALRGERRCAMPLPVIFNDYMNCLWASPTTEKELPMIRAAAQIGCEYYVVDAGWYTDGDWWYEVGDWHQSLKRFPNGIREVMDAIRNAGMIPGIWLEIETMGIQSPKLKDCDDSWFFMRHGKRVVVHGRYQLDFTNPKVRAFATETIRRVVEEYGVGYIKMDYNINPGIGTEQNADSCGDGLLKHQRAYLEWLEETLDHYPQIVLENCASGAMRSDYAMLRISAIQSTSDQPETHKYVSVAVNAPAAVLPEQSGIWCFPVRTSTREEIIMNVVNSALLRMQISGTMGELSESAYALIAEGIRYHKSIREDIRNAMPFWPLDFARNGDGWSALGMECGKTIYLAVWRMQSGNEVCTMNIEQIRGKKADACCGYPKNDADCRIEVNAENGTVSVFMPQTESARIFEIHITE